MKPKAYLETTISSYLTAWRSRDLIKAAHQEATREWWESRSRFDLYIKLARRLIRKGPIPEKAALDALHIALATVHGMDYLLTWNCTHIANAATRGRIEEVCRENGLTPPTICTPIELMEI